MDNFEHAQGDGPKPACSGLAVYLCFMLVGNGCGWFVDNSLWQNLANVPELTQGGRMFGKVTVIIGAVGLGVALVYCLSLALGSMSMRTGQRLSSLLIVSNVAAFLLLLFFWDAGAPEYPMFIAAAVFGSVIAWGTYFVLFPLVSAFYGGWLVAPVRAGTDLSSLVTSLLGEAQNPTGAKNLFPTWVLYTVYTCLSVCGLAAWTVILRHGLGLRQGAEMEQEETARQQAQARREAQPEEEALEAELPTLPQKLRHLAGGMACPRSLIAPIACATLSQILQWSLVVCIAQIGARMTDPDGCDGDAGKKAYRIALTLASVFVPVGSLASSFGACPRWTFYGLAALQLAAAIAVVLATAGVAQDVWMTAAARAAYVGCVAMVAGLEGYLLTMAYRYIGDDEKLPLRARLSASSLLSFLSVAVVNPFSIAMGVLVDNGSIDCRT